MEFFECCVLIVAFSSYLFHAYHFRMKHNFKKLQIWKTAFELCRRTYELSTKFPKEEKYGLKSQIRRCAVSVPSNIAEGCGRESRKETKRFFDFAIASNCELETQLRLAIEFGYLQREPGKEIIQEIELNRKMIVTFVEKRLGG